MSNDSKVISINPYSLASYYVELYYGDDKIGNATCFFTKRQSQLYLVTNLHVVTGVDTDTRAYSHFLRKPSFVIQISPCICVYSRYNMQICK